MVAYSIKDLENLSGVKAHTLRIWEKRYGIIQPSRTDTNIRYYTDVDLHKVLNISFLNRNGYKISKIALMSNDEIRQKIAEYTEVGAFFEDQVDSLMMSMFELDDSKFNIILEQEIISNGFEATMNNIIFPLLDKLGMMWIAGSIKAVHENFVSNFIRRKTIIEIDRISKNTQTINRRCIVYLPENENHELSLLFLHYILASQQTKVVNLGTGISLIDVLEAKEIFKPQYIFTIFNDSFAESTLQPYISEMAKNASDCKILISGFQAATQDISLPPNVSILNSIQSVKDFILSENTAH